MFVNGSTTGPVTPVDLELAPSTYEIELRRRADDDPRFGYYLRRTVTVASRAEIVVDTVLSSQIELAEVRIRTFNPNGPGRP